MLCCRIVNGIKNKNIKKQPWNKVECFAFGGGIVWLAAWKLVSNDAKRTVAPPDATHSTLFQGCF